MTEWGIVMLISLSHHSNVHTQIFVTEFGIVIFSRLLQPAKVDPPILVTESGMVTFVILSQPENARSPYAVRYNYLGHTFLFGVFLQYAVADLKSHISPISL